MQCNNKQKKTNTPEQEDKVCKKVMNRILRYGDKVAVVTSPSEAKEVVKNWGLFLNDTTETYIDEKLFGALKNYICYGYYFDGNHGPVQCLKPKGIGNGAIYFAPTECSTTEEYLKKEEEKNNRCDAIEREIFTLANSVLSSITKGLYCIGISDHRCNITPEFTLYLKWDGVRIGNGVHGIWYKNEDILHVPYDTLIADDIKNIDIFEYLNSLKK